MTGRWIYFAKSALFNAFNHFRPADEQLQQWLRRPPWASVSSTKQVLPPDSIFMCGKFVKFCIYCHFCHIVLFSERTIVITLRVWPKIDMVPFLLFVFWGDFNSITVVTPKKHFSAHAFKGMACKGSMQRKWFTL